MKDWLRKHWPIVVAVVIVLAAFFISRYSRSEYNKSLKAKDDFIEHLMSEYEQLEDSVKVARELTKQYKSELAVYQDSLSDSRVKYFNQQKRHAEEMVAFKRIPTDEHYRELTRWLDSIPLQ